MKTFVEIGTSSCPDFLYLLDERRDGLPEWRGVFVEPAPANISPLLNAIEATDANNNYEIVLGAVSSTSSIKRFYSDSWHECTFVASINGIMDGDEICPARPMYVSTFTLDALFKKLGIQHLQILRLDIEGAEYDVLSSYSWSVRPEKVLVEFHAWDKNNTFEKITEILSVYGYKFTHFDGSDHVYELPNCSVSDIERRKQPWEQ